MNKLQAIRPFGFAATFLLATTIGTRQATSDVVIDEFTHVDVLSNPWPLEQTSAGGDQFFETVEGGVIAGDSGRIRETDVHLLGFDDPGGDQAVLGVNLDTGTFDHAATAGVANLIQFSYGFVIDNNLHADLSETVGLRIDLADLQPDPGGALQVSARLGDGSGVIAEFGPVLVTEPGGGSVLLPFAEFESAEVIDLADIGAIEVSLYATPGTDFSIERLVAAQPVAGDVNADAAVDLADFLAVIEAWGECAGCPEDLDADGVVGVTDLLAVLANWGL